MISYWRDIVNSFPCETCNAGPGEVCRTITGNRKNEPHAPRAYLAARNADKCHKCGDRLPAESDPGDTCGRCRLIRRMEIERATTWQRRH